MLLAALTHVDLVFKLTVSYAFPPDATARREAVIGDLIDVFESYACQAYLDGGAERCHAALIHEAMIHSKVLHDKLDLVLSKSSVAGTDYEVYKAVALDAYASRRPR